MDIHIRAQIEQWPIAGAFVIARGAKSVATLVVASVSLDGVCGWGECAPYARYGETPEDVRDSISSQAALMQRAASIADARAIVNDRMPPGAARNALDCALWDLEAKLSGAPVWRLAGLAPPRPVVTAYTISLGAPDEMARAAHAARSRPLLKLKLGGDDAARIASVRAAAPDARLIVDANESWTLRTWAENLEACVAAGVALIEQPFPSDEDAALSALPHPVPVCADESAHDAGSIEPLANRYEAVNVKLDKTGGLTGAIEAVGAARDSGLAVMLGCMVSTSLSMAPAMLLAQQADYVDLDGPLLLRQDRRQGVTYDGSVANPASPALWGAP